MTLELFNCMISDYNKSFDNYAKPLVGECKTWADVSESVKKLIDSDLDRAIAALKLLKQKKSAIIMLYDYSQQLKQEEEYELDIEQENKYLDYQKSLLMESNFEEEPIINPFIPFEDKCHYSNTFAEETKTEY